MKLPQAIAKDSKGNLFVADQDNIVREIYPDGTMKTIAGNGSYWPYPPGDVNADGVVTLTDVSLMLQFVLGIKSPLDIQIKQGDTRPHPGSRSSFGDNKLKMADVNWVLRKALGLEAYP